MPMTRNMQLFWEYLNYGLAFFGLLVVWYVRRSMRKKTVKRHLALLQNSTGRI
jgi:ABC-2 type transport system permease protein